MEQLSTRHLILEHAVLQLDTAGSEAFRIDDVCAEAFVSKSSIYHFFGSRAGLIAAAECERYKASFLAEDRDPVAAADACTNRNEFMALVLAQIERSVLDPENERVRTQRVAVIARAIETGDARDEVAATQAAFIHELAVVFERAQEKGFVNPTLDCHAYAAFMHTLTLGRTLTAGGFADTARWLEVAGAAAVAPLTSSDRA